MDEQFLTEEERELLYHARWSCSCESYYRFQCSKCQQVGKGFVTDRQKAVDSLINIGMIYRNSYHGIRPTKAGHKFCGEIGVKTFHCYNKEAREHEY